MISWSKRVEDELALLIKDWLKQHGRTQADLGECLESESSRMPALIETIKKEYSQGGFPKLVSRLCQVEKEWSTSKTTNPISKENLNSFGQLDLLLEELREGSNEKN